MLETPKTRVFTYSFNFINSTKRDEKKSTQFKIIKIILHANQIKFKNILFALFNLLKLERKLS